MKTVLIIAYAFPPNGAIGSQRPYRLSKYFPKFGWNPIVLTIKRPGDKPQDIRIIETDDKDIIGSIKSKLGFESGRSVHEQLGISITKNFNHLSWKSKLMKLLRETIDYPDDQKGWYNYALKSASQFLSKEKVDVIISTSSPVTSHLVARELKQIYKIPWVADLRDLWTQNHYYEKYAILKYFERRLEFRTLSEADVLVTANPLVDTLKNLHKDKEIVWITNGYDTDEFSETATKLTNKFTITYAGTLYNGKRDPSMLLGVVKELIDEHKISKELIEIRFVGCDEAWLDQEIKRNNLRGIVNTYGYVARVEALRMQKESQLLLLLLWDNKNEEGILPGKIFEYLGARRPIIAYGGSGGAVSDLLRITNAGKFAKDAESLRNCLLTFFQEFSEKGKIRDQSNGDAENYTCQKITEKYSELLNSLT